MSLHSLSKRIALRFSQAHRAAGVVLAAALVTAACGDGATAVNSSAVSTRRASVSATASSFAVLAKTAATCTDGTITGDVGTYLAATGSFTQTDCSVTGTVHVGDGAAVAGYNAFVAAYEGLTPVPGEACTLLTGALSGVTLAPGVYCFDAAAELTGVLTLKGPWNGTWVFLVGTSGTGALTGTNFSVVMDGGALPCNVTWWVAQAATMTDSRFVGTIMAGAAITLTRGTFAGNAWSQADVTITGTAVVGCNAGITSPSGKVKCNQGVGNGFEGCDPGNSNNHNPTNDEDGGIPGKPGRKP